MTGGSGSFGVVAALVLAAGAGYLLPAPSSLQRIRRARVPAGSSLGSRPGLFGGVLAGVGSAVVLGSALVLALGVLLGWAYDRRRAAGRQAQQAALTRAACQELCLALAGELRAGRSPREALRWAACEAAPPADSGTVPRPAEPAGDRPFAGVAAALDGTNTVAALRDLATRPGAASLRRLAACWQVAEESGAGLAQAVERIAATLQAEEALRREVRAQLAGPRATARMLAGLPALGLLLGAALGARPLEVLLHTAYGVGCLVAGILLAAAGVVWTDRLARAVELAE